MEEEWVGSFGIPPTEFLFLADLLAMAPMIISFHSNHFAYLSMKKKKGKKNSSDRRSAIGEETSFVRGRRSAGAIVFGWENKGMKSEKLGFVPLLLLLLLPFRGPTKAESTECKFAFSVR